MVNSIAVKRYSKAFFAIIKEKDYQSFLEDISFLRNSLDKTNPKVKELLVNLNSIVFNKSKRFSYVKAIVSNLSNRDVWFSFFSLLIQKHRLNLISNILWELDKMLLKAKNVKRVKLVLATKHNDDIISEINRFVRKKINRDVIFDIIIDKSIVGGFVAKTDQIVIDGSIKNNFNKLIEN